MNPKLMSLYKQAMDFSGDTGTTHFEFMIFVEEFSRLIVEECTNVVLVEGKKIADSMPKATRENYVQVAEQTGRVNASLNLNEKIREHFGTTKIGRGRESTSSSWEGQIDRQSGAFTQEEIDNSTAWK